MQTTFWKCTLTIWNQCCSVTFKYGNKSFEALGTIYIYISCANHSIKNRTNITRRIILYIKPLNPQIFSSYAIFIRYTSCNECVLTIMYTLYINHKNNILWHENQPKPSKTKKKRVHFNLTSFILSNLHPLIYNIVNDKTSLLEINQHFEYHKIINNSCWAYFNIWMIMNIVSSCIHTVKFRCTSYR